MDAIQNPFAPGAGSQPPELVGREAILEQARVTVGRVKRGRAAKSLMIVGLRGVGKTVLLNRIQELAESECYIAELLEAPESKSLAALIAPPVRSLILKLDRGERLGHAVQRAFRTLRSFVASVKLTYSDVALSFDGEREPGVADSGDLEVDVADLLLTLGEAARERKTAVVLIIDELQYLREVEMSALIMALHRISQKGLPLTMIEAGLPQLVGLTGRSKSYAERLFDFPQAGALDRDQAARALQNPTKQEGVTFTKAALDEIYRLTQGYPYFLQEWGYHCWLCAEKSPINLDVVDRATPQAIANLDRSFFLVRFDRLTPAEKRYLAGMAALGPGPHRSGDIAAKLGVKVTSTAPVRSSLITKGMIYSRAHGETEFTVPLFDEFMRRQAGEASI